MKEETPYDTKRYSDFDFRPAPDRLLDRLQYWFGKCRRTGFPTGGYILFIRSGGIGGSFSGKRKLRRRNVCPCL